VTLFPEVVSLRLLIIFIVIISSSLISLLPDTKVK